MNTMNKTRRVGLSVLVAGAMLFGASHARAAHTNFVHGAMCSSSDATVLFDDGGAGNTSTNSSVMFYCPVINADPNAINNASGRVRGWDGDNTSWAFVCTGVLRNFNSEVISFVGDAQGPLTTGYTGPVIIPNTGNGNLNFPVAVTSNDSLVISCSVPPRSALYNVRVDN
jgi:hypothetical protein